MATDPAKPPRITGALLAEYVAARTQRLEIEQSAKPYADKEKQLAEVIRSALIAGGITTKKAGDYRALLIEKAGPTPWKEECVKRLQTGELEAIQAAIAPRITLEVQPA